MDNNKLKVLREIGYRIMPTCGDCVWAEFPQDDWGTCGLHDYQHEKHTGEKRQLSIHKSGNCPQFEVATLAHLSHFAEFFDDGSG